MVWSSICPEHMTWHTDHSSSAWMPSKCIY